MKCKCGSEMKYTIQEQEYPGAKVWPAYLYCGNCGKIVNESINSDSIKENTRGW